MIEALSVAYYEGKIICAFPEKETCKKYIKENYPEIDGFDVIIKTQYASDRPSSNYMDRDRLTENGQARAVVVDGRENSQARAVVVDGRIVEIEILNRQANAPLAKR